MVLVGCILVKGRVFPKEGWAVNLEAGMIHEMRSCAGGGTQKLSAELPFCEPSVMDLGIDLGVFIHLQVFTELSDFICINK